MPGLVLFITRFPDHAAHKMGQREMIKEYRRAERMGIMKDGRIFKIVMPNSIYPHYDSLPGIRFDQIFQESDALLTLEQIEFLRSRRAVSMASTEADYITIWK